MLKISLFSLLVIMLALALSGPDFALAQNPGGPSSGAGPPSGGAGPPIIVVSTYLSNLYLWFLGFIGVAALFAIVRGGVTYMFSGANPALVGEAKRCIWNAIWGIVLAAASFLLLWTINPDLITHGFDIESIINSRPSSIPGPLAPGSQQVP